MKFFDKFLGPKSSPEKAEGAGAGLNHIARPDYFTDERSAAIKTSLQRCGVNVTNIENLP